MRHFGFVVGLLCPLYIYAVEHSDDWVHLGAPPKGLSFVEIRSEGAVAPVVLAGTLKPAVLTVNGQKVKLVPAEKADVGTGLWIQGKSYPTQDVMGRFFVQLDGTDAAVENLEVILNQSRAEVILNRIFLEAPLFQQLVFENLPADEKKVYDFKFQGEIGKDTELKFSGEVIAPSADGKITVPISLAVGKKTLTAELKRKGSSKRIINLPLLVERTDFKEGATILSFKTPKEQGGALKFEGLTNPGAQLKINGEDVDVDSKGGFKWRLLTDEPSGKVKFAAKEKTFEYDYICLKCKAKRTRQSVSVKAGEVGGFVFSGNDLPGDVITSYSLLGLDHVVLSYVREIRPAWSLVVELGYAEEFDGNDSDEYRLQVQGVESFSVGADYEFSEQIHAAVLLSYMQADLRSVNFPSSENTLESAGIGFYLEGNYPLKDDWIYAPRMTLMHSSLSFLKDEAPASWLYASWHLLGVRREF